MSTLVEHAGTAAGLLAAPVFALTSRLRRARTFHPEGEVALAEVRAIPGAGHLAERLAGPALVRLSGALSRSRRFWPDVLGCAIRFRATAAPSTEPEPGDQDLLFATIRRPWTMPFAPFATDTRDYFTNPYFAVSPFDVGAPRRVYFRLRDDAGGARAGGRRGTRRDRLEAAIREGHARFVLETRREGTRVWMPIATITLRALVEVDQERLRFSPFRDGRGVVPRGFVHALRRAVYPASQAARPSHALPSGAESPQLEVTTLDAARVGARSSSRG